MIETVFTPWASLAGGVLIGLAATLLMLTLGRVMGATGVLSGKTSCFEVPNITVRIEGHCDERGTTDYNLALGLRRAETVKRYLVSQGVPPSRITTTSYGEEKPLVSGSNESAWSQNRRAEIIISE